MSKCIEWAGAKDEKGYGLVRIGDVLHRTHRLAFRLFKGRLIRGMQICHACDNPACYNPEHLFQGTQSANQQDSVSKRRHVNSKKDTCPKGHPYSGKNVYRRKDKPGRECRECVRLATARWRLRNGV